MMKKKEKKYEMASIHPYHYYPREYSREKSLDRKKATNDGFDAIVIT